MSLVKKNSLLDLSVADLYARITEAKRNIMLTKFQIARGEEVKNRRVLRFLRKIIAMCYTEIVSRDLKQSSIKQS